LKQVSGKDLANAIEGVRLWQFDGTRLSTLDARLLTLFLRILGLFVVRQIPSREEARENARKAGCR
jgi:hypothetical protein